MEKILATNDKREGLIPMKQGKEQEVKKTVERKNIGVCNFIKNAFCLDGDVKMVSSDTPVTSKLFFRCSDSKRGKIWVAYGELKQEDGNFSQA